MRHWPYAYRALQQDKRIRDRFGVAPLPGPSALGGHSLAIAAHTRRPNAARALIDFLTSEESQRTLFQKGGFAATRASVYHDKAVVGQYPYATMLLAVVQGAKHRPPTPYYNQVSLVFQRRVHEALEQGRPPDPDGLAQALEQALRGT